MIIIFGWSSMLLALAAVMLLGSVVFAIWNAITEAKEESANMPEKELSTPQRIGVLANILLIFLSVLAVAYGFTEHNGVAGTVGILVWMIASVIVAYTCSPLRMPVSDSGNQGCGYLLISPLLMIMSLVSMLLIMFTSWIFGLIVLLKGLSKKVYILIGACILLLVGVATGVGVYQSIEENKADAYQVEVVNGIFEKVQISIDEAKPEAVVFTQEEQAVLSQMELKPFTTADVKEMIAKKFSALYRENDFEGIVDLGVFLTVNRANYFVGGELSAEIVFDIDFLNYLSREIRNRAGQTESSADQTLVVDGREFFLGGQFVYFEVPEAGEYSSILLGSGQYREKHYKDYNEDPYGVCYIVGSEVEYTETKDQSMYPATCPRCGTTFRGNTTYASMIRKHGYCGMGLCGKD